MRNIIIDGMLSGTGIRDPIVGEYIDPVSIGLDADICRRLSTWLNRYEMLHYNNYDDKIESHNLDVDGIRIAKEIRNQLNSFDVTYYSNAELKRMPID